MRETESRVSDLATGVLGNGEEGEGRRKKGRLTRGETAAASGGLRCRGSVSFQKLEDGGGLFGNIGRVLSANQSPRIKVV